MARVVQRIRDGIPPDVSQAARILMSLNGLNTTPSESDPRPRVRGSCKNIAVTALLLAITIVVGVVAYDARSEFWDMYLAVKTNK
jgi:hypothetical protein